MLTKKERLDTSDFYTFYFNSDVIVGVKKQGLGDKATYEYLQYDGDFNPVAERKVSGYNPETYELTDIFN